MGYPTLSAHTHPRRSVQAVLADFLITHFAKTKVTRPYKTRSEKHPNLPRRCANGNSVALPLILGESRRTRKLPIYFRVADDPEVTRAFASTTITTAVGISVTSAFLKPRLLVLP
jgi:hypothetical protein